MNVLLGVAKNQGNTIAEVAQILEIDYGRVHQIIERLGIGGGAARNGYTIKGLQLVHKVKWGKSLKGQRCLYLTPKGLKFVKRITKNKR